MDNYKFINEEQWKTKPADEYPRNGAKFSEA